MTDSNAASPNTRFDILSIVMMFILVLTVLFMNAVVLPLTGRLPDVVERLTFFLLAVLPPLLAG